MSGRVLNITELFHKRNLNIEQNIEYDKIKKLSEQVIVDNFKRNPTRQNIFNGPNGFTIVKTCAKQKKKKCNWNIKININTNEANM